MAEKSSQPNNDGPESRTYPGWHNFVAGGFAGAGSRVATAPLDLIRIRRQLSPVVTYPSESLWQTWNKIVQNEGGVTALFRGNVAAIYLWVGYSAVQFSLYNKTKDFLIKDVDLSTTVAAFWAGAWAGTWATLFSYPFDVCRTTFAARGLVESSQSPRSPMTPLDGAPKTPGHHYSSSRTVPFSSLVEPHFNHKIPPLETKAKVPKTLKDFAYHIYKQKGVFGFYAGAGPAVLQIIPYMGLNFAIYDLLVEGDNRVNASGYAGALSGATSKLLVYPIDTVKRRLQAQAFYDASLSSNRTSRQQYTGMVDCFLRILREESVASLYRGIFPSVLKTTIASSLSFALFRFAKNTLMYAHDQR